MNQHYRRNYFTFGIGTIGRDMIYNLITLWLLTFLTEPLDLADGTIAWITGIIVAARIFDAINDPVMGNIVDNTRTRFGKFKPWITIGAFFSGLFTILLFTDFGLTGAPFVALFGVFYVAWGITFTANDISYWSMLPSLSVNQKDRENMGAFARICANIGLFTIVAGFVPIRDALMGSGLSEIQAYFAIVSGAVVIMWLGQLVTVIGVVEPKELFTKQQATPLKELLGVIVKNDQLLVLAIAMTVFMIGYVTTTNFGFYFFKYAYGDEGVFSLFALVLGVSQLGALAFFPLFSKRFTRAQLFTTGMILVVVGYIIFFFAPMNMLVIGPAGVLIFVGQAFIQLLMFLFLADSIEYGQWKLGRRNESITFSLQPFINKMGGAVATGITGWVLILSGINSAETPSDVSDGGLLLMKIAMMIFPLILIVVSYVVYRSGYKIDEAFYAKIISDLKERGDIADKDDPSAKALAER
jgi:melibiose permease/lactose/raffinose/galactose permease